MTGRRDKPLDPLIGGLPPKSKGASTAPFEHPRLRGRSPRSEPLITWSSIGRRRLLRGPACGSAETWWIVPLEVVSFRRTGTDRLDGGEETEAVPHWGVSGGVVDSPRRNQLI